MQLGSIWERISTLGAKVDDSPGERRRLVLTNQSAVIGVVSCGSFAIGYAVAGSRFFLPMIANIVAVTCFIFALVLTRRGARTLAKLAVLVPANGAVVTATMLLGTGIGLLYYFFLFAAVAFLLFGEKERFFRWLLAILALGCCLFARLVAPRNDAVVHVAPWVADVLDVFFVVVVLATVIFMVDLFTSETTRAEERLAEEHARSERLLLNILPGAISERLKTTQGAGDERAAIADGFAEVTVLFADIVGFTELSQRLDPAALVKMLNRIFSAFDDLAEKLGLEKIKTIGDCYMVASGLPTPRPDHAQAAAHMALGMRDALVRVNEESGYALHLRIGLHSGPVVAGVIGKRKFIYDLWGDTVNTASRMESSGVVDEIQVTREVHDRVGGEFEMEARGTIKVKGKGEMETFLLKRPRAL
jgi:adenylate cyclase